MSETKENTITKKDIALVVSTIILTVSFLAYYTVTSNRLTKLEQAQAASQQVDEKADQKFDTLIQKNDEIIQRLTRVETLLEKKK